MHNPEKFEPQFEEKFGEEAIPAIEKKDIGKEAERTIATPLFKELGDIFLEVEHTSEEVDGKKGIDFVLGFSNGDRLAVQFSIAESKDIWEKKARKVVQSPLVELGEIHPNLNSLSRKERIEKVPVILVRVRRSAVEDAYSEFKMAGEKGNPFDFLPNKEELKQTVLIQMLANLLHFSTERELARHFPHLPRIAKERYDFLNQKINPPQEEKGLQK